MGSNPFDYDLAFSFASEDRSIVQPIVTELQKRGVRVFYDTLEQASLWGADLYQRLADVYGRRARYCVVFVSEAYAAREWTSHELRSAQERALRESEAYILPVRLDETELPGLPSTVGYVDLRRDSQSRLIELLLEKLGPNNLIAASADRNPAQQSNPAPDRKVRLPRVQISSIDPMKLALAFVEDLGALIDVRMRELESHGFGILHRRSGDADHLFRVTRGAELLYYVRFWVGGAFGATSIAFDSGWNEPISQGALTASGEVCLQPHTSVPVIHLTNFSLLGDSVVESEMSTTALCDAIWEEACDTIESILAQR